MGVIRALREVLKATLFQHALVLNKKHFEFCENR